MILRIIIRLFLFTSILLPNILFSQIVGPDTICGGTIGHYIAKDCMASDGNNWILRSEEGGQTYLPSEITSVDVESAARLEGSYDLICERNSFGWDFDVTDECARKRITIIKTATPSNPNAQICEGEKLDFSKAVSGDIIKWYSDSVSTTNINPVSPTVAGTHKYYVTNTKNNCESERIAFKIDVHSRVLPTVVSSSSSCEGDSLDITSKVSGDSINWYSSSQSSAPLTTKPANPTKTGTYTYFVTNIRNNCESSKVSFSISVKAKPPLPYVANTYLCLGTTLDLATKVTGESIHWYDSIVSIEPLNNIPSVPATVGTYTYYVTNNRNKCESAKVPFTVILAKPLPPVFSQSTINYCQFSPADSVIKALSALGDYNWYSDSTGNTAAASLVPSTNLPKTFTYYVSQDSLGCESDRALLTVKVNPSPRIKTTDIILNESMLGDLSTAFSDSNNTSGTVTYWKDFHMTQMLDPLEAKVISTPGIYYIKKTVGECESVSSIKVSTKDRTDQNITFPPMGSKTYGNLPMQLTAIASSELPITYYTSDSSIASIKNNFLTIKSVGEVTITATQNGNNSFNPASNESQKLIIKKASQKIALAHVSAKRINEPSFQIEALASSRLTLHYTLISGPATVSSSGFVSLSKTTSGLVTIKITQPGDKNYSPVETSVSFELLSNILEAKNFPIKLSPKAINGISISCKPKPIIKEVVFFYKNITDTNFDSLIVVPKGKLYTPDLTKKIGEIGLRYYFRIEFDTSFVELTDTAITYAYYDQGLVLPSIEAGNQSEDYKIISIPLLLEATKVSDVFEELGPEDKTKWRIFQYNSNDASNKELTGNDSILPGKGYWIISKNPMSINTGKGTAVKVTEKAPFKIKLKKGYNQIGNPYNFPISWDQIFTFNNLPVGVDSKVKIFKQTGWQSSTTIQTFEGAYVFTDRDIDINIPVQKIDTLPLKSSSLREESHGWSLPLTLSNNTGFKTEGAIGMSSDASESKDRHDEITLPRFQKYLEINFSHPEYFAPKFSHDVVPVSENHIWNFSIESSTKEGNLSLQWDASECRNQKEQFYLLDSQSGVVINMKDKAEYRVANTGAKNLAIYYGDESFIQSSLAPIETRILEPYPNPFSESITVPYILSNSEYIYHVEISLYDVFMKKQLILEKGNKEAGYYSVVWDRGTASSQKAAAGLYFIKVQVSSNGNQKEWLKKVIVK